MVELAVTDELKAEAQRKGNDSAFLLWTRHQPCAITGRFDGYGEDGRGYVDAAHYRTAANSGTAMKPSYSALPLSREVHMLQHQHGLAECLRRTLGGKWDRQSASEWFRAKAEENLRKWVGDS